MTDEQTPPPRTAAASAARRRQGEERAAAYLRERGWTCTPPAGNLEAYVTPDDVPGWLSVRVMAGGVAEPVARFAAAGHLRAGEHPGRALDAIAEQLAGQGYVLDGGWRVGGRPGAMHATVPVKRNPGTRERESGGA